MVILKDREEPQFNQNPRESIVESLTPPGIEPWPFRISTKRVTTKPTWRASQQTRWWYAGLLLASEAVKNLKAPVINLKEIPENQESLNKWLVIIFISWILGANP